MPTIRLVPSSYSVSSSNRVSVSSPGNMYYNTDHTANYCSIRGRNSSSSTYYAFIKGFNFDDVPSNAVVSSFSVKIRCYRNSYLQQGTTYRPRLASSNSNSYVISDTTLESDVTTTSGGTVYTFPLPSSLTWAMLKGYGANFSIEIPLRSSGSSYPYLYVYGAEIEVTYSTNVSVTGVALDKSTDTVAVGSTTTLTATVSPSNATNKAVAWSTSDASVATVSDGVVTGVAAGSATITVTTTDGGYTATCAVTVTSGGGGTWTTIFDDDVQLIPDSPYNYIYYSGFSGAFEANTTYRVTWDGVTYTCQSQPNANTYDGYSVGNLALGAGGTDTGEPFLLYRAFWDSTVLTADTTTSAGEYGRWIHCKIEKLSGGNPPPVITVGTPSQTTISAITGHDQCVCTFTSDLALQQWEARATKAGVTPARGVGLLVESGGALAANTPATIYVENEELTQGDGEYTITVYGQSTDGVWSE